MIKQIIYFGNTTDGQEHWVEADLYGGSIVPEQDKYPIEERCREYYPFLESLQTVFIMKKPNILKNESKRERFFRWLAMICLAFAGSCRYDIDKAFEELQN